MTTFGDYEWFKLLSAEDYSNLILQLKKGVNQIRKYNSILTCSYWTDYDEGRALVQRLYSSIGDMANLQEEADSFKLWKLIFKVMIPLLNNLGSQSPHIPAGYFVSIDYYMKATRIQKQTSSMNQKLLNKRHKLAAVPFNVLEGLEISGAAALITTKTQFSNVNAAIDRVVEKTQQALTLGVATEEEYFLEQVQEAYLPHIISSALTVKGVSADLKAEAIRNFIQQLALLEEKVSTIIQETSKNALQEVQNQTRFLELSLQESKKELTR